MGPQQHWKGQCSLRSGWLQQCDLRACAPFWAECGMPCSQASLRPSWPTSGIWRAVIRQRAMSPGWRRSDAPSASSRSISPSATRLQTLALSPTKDSGSRTVSTLHESRGGDSLRTSLATSQPMHGCLPRLGRACSRSWPNSTVWSAATLRPRTPALERRKPSMPGIGASRMCAADCSKGPPKQQTPRRPTSCRTGYLVVAGPILWSCWATCARPPTKWLRPRSFTLRHVRVLWG
jgi:hypothetical protein